MKKMTKPKFLYIDDENDQTVKSFIGGFNDTGIILVEDDEAKVFEEQLAILNSNLKNYDGLMLDLRLDGKGTGIIHTALSLAQELRSKTAAKESYYDIPIILCSTDKKIEDLYNKDQTSHDLFDFIVRKDKQNDWVGVSNKLKSISDGYKIIKEYDSTLDKIFNRDISRLDTRIFGKFLNDEEKYPIHDLAQHVLKELINHPGPLIDDLLLAARLGVDIEHSPDWVELRNNCFSDAKYTGIFSDGWHRWWADTVIEIFKTLTGKRLSALKAPERVRLLQEKCGLEKLVAARPIEKSISDNFWTICDFFKKPLDPLEGFKVLRQKELYPWQDYLYLSFEAAAERRGKIHPSEKGRLEAVKQSFKKSEIMNVPRSVMAIRNKRASELELFARLLEKVNLGYFYQIYAVADDLRDSSKGFHSPGTTDYNCWGYNIEDLTFYLPEVPQKHIHPKTIHSIQLSMDVKLLCKYNGWETIDDPLIQLNFRVRIIGLDTQRTYSFGFHIDKHNEAQDSDELHPVYHLHYTPAVNGNEDIGNVLSLDCPRIMHAPMELILGTDLVLSNFSPNIWDRLRDEAEYQALYKRYQDYIWKPYIHTFASHWTYDKEDICWNSPKSICPYLVD